MAHESFCRLKTNSSSYSLQSSLGDVTDDNDFTDVTLACDDGQQVEAHKVILADCSPQTNAPTLMFELNGSSSDDRKTQCALYQIENLVSPPFRIATLVESGTIEGQIGEGFLLTSLLTSLSITPSTTTSKICHYETFKHIKRPCC